VSEVYGVFGTWNSVAEPRWERARSGQPWVRRGAHGSRLAPTRASERVLINLMGGAAGSRRHVSGCHG
jgi:hypothetical protein